MGAYFDPIADKILLSVIYISLGAREASPGGWSPWCSDADLLILAMAAYALLFTSLRRFPPSVWGKISTFLQISAALVRHGRAQRHPRTGLSRLVAHAGGYPRSGFYYAWRGLRC